MRRRIYGWVLALHPREFRERFGPEMQVVFEDAGGGWWLIGDGLISLARQRLWRALGMVLLPMVPWLLMTWWLRPDATVRETAPLPLPLEFLLLVAVSAVVTAALTTLLALTWHRIRRPLRRKHA